MGCPSPARPPYIRVSSLVPYPQTFVNRNTRQTNGLPPIILREGVEPGLHAKEVIRIVYLRQSGRHQILRKRMVVTGAPGKPL